MERRTGSINWHSGRPPDWTEQKRRKVVWTNGPPAEFLRIFGLSSYPCITSSVVSYVGSFFSVFPFTSECVFRLSQLAGQAVCWCKKLDLRFKGSKKPRPSSQLMLAHLPASIVAVFPVPSIIIVLWLILQLPGDPPALRLRRLTLPQRDLCVWGRRHSLGGLEAREGAASPNGVRAPLPLCLFQFW